MIEKKINISVVITTFNEKKNLYTTVKSLINQTIQPDEIIVSEGGCVKLTNQIIKDLKKKYNNIQIILRKKKCRGGGRNEGITQASNDFIVIIDAGAIAKKNWIEEFIKIFNINKNAEIIYGSVKPIRNNAFSRNVANIITGKNIQNFKIKKSVSSIFFKKKIWVEVGGFAESNDNSYVVEDLRFLESLQRFKSNSYYSSKSIVYWAMPRDINSLIKRFSEYSCGAIENGYTRTWHTPLVRNYVIILILLILFFSNKLILILVLLFFFILRSYFYLKNYETYSIKKTKFYYDLFYTSFLLLVVDLSTIIGFLKYIKKKITKIK